MPGGWSQWRYRLDSCPHRRAGTGSPAYYNGSGSDRPPYHLPPPLSPGEIGAPLNYPVDTAVLPLQDRFWYRRQQSNSTATLRALVQFLFALNTAARLEAAWRARLLPMR